MLPAINFYDELFSLAEEVCEKASDGDLAAEFEVMKAAITQLCPEDRFGLRLGSTQIAGEGEFFRFESHNIYLTLLPEGEGVATRRMRGIRREAINYSHIRRIPLTRPSGTLSLGERGQNI